MSRESLSRYFQFAILIPAVLIAFQLIAVFAVYFLVLPVFQEKHDQKRADGLSRRAISAFWYGNSDLNLLCSDWAHRNEMADAVHHWTSDFAQKNLPDGICDDYNMDILLVLDRNGKVLFTQTARDRFRSTFVPEAQSKTMESLLNTLRSQSYRLNGLTLLTGTPFYVQTQPVTNEAETEEPPVPQGYLVMARHLGNSFTSRLSTVLQLPTQMAVFNLKDNAIPAWFSGSTSSLNTGLIRFQHNPRYLEVISYIAGTPSGTGLILRITADKTHSFASRNVLWGLLIFLLLTSSLMALHLNGTQRLFKRRLHFLLSIVGKISGRLSIPTARIHAMDDLDSLHEVLNNLYWNLQKIEKEKEKLRSREMIREKLVSAGRIAAELSHEILTPIRVIQNCLSPIQRKLSTSSLTDKDREMFDMVQKELNEMENLTRNLLRFFREDEVDGSSTELIPVVRSAIERFQAITGENGPTLLFQVNGNGRIFVSARQLEQVLLNLLRNAMEAACTEIRVSTSIKDDVILVRVSDDGDGIPEEIRNRIFEPFFTRKKKRGVGLGLNISYNIIRNYDGELFLEENEQMTTCFVIQLPLMEEIHGKG